MGVAVWLLSLFAAVQALVETVAATLIRPIYVSSGTICSVQKLSPKEDWGPEVISAKIESLPLFSHFHEEQLDKIIAGSQLLEIPAGAVVIDEGEPARELYVLLDGRVEVVRVGHSLSTEWISELGAISVFGEAALVDDQPRGARLSLKARIGPASAHILASSGGG